MANQKMRFDQFTQGATGMNEAMMQCGSIAQKNMENMMKTYFNMFKKNSERQADMMKKIMDCRNVTDYTELQSKLVQENLKDFMSSANEISEMNMKCASESINPINEQVGKAVKKAKQSMAA